MRRTLKRTKSKKQQGRVRDLKPAKEAKGSAKIEHAVERHETAVTEDAKELKKPRESMFLSSLTGTVFLQRVPCYRMSRMNASQ